MEWGRLDQAPRHRRDPRLPRRSLTLAASGAMMLHGGTAAAAAAQRGRTITDCLRACIHHCWAGALEKNEVMGSALLRRSVCAAAASSPQEPLPLPPRCFVLPACSPATSSCFCDSCEAVQGAHGEGRMSSNCHCLAHPMSSASPRSTSPARPPTHPHCAATARGAIGVDDAALAVWPAADVLASVDAYTGG